MSAEKPVTYEAWRITYQTSEAAARAAFSACVTLRAALAIAERQRDEARERLEKLEALLRLIEADDWPGMIELAKQAGIPDAWEHTHNPEDYELTGFHDDDGKYTYPTRANLTAALSRNLLANPAPAPQAPRTPSVEEVEGAIGCTAGAWDMVDPAEIIEAVMRLSAAPAPQPSRLPRGSATRRGGRMSSEQSPENR